MREVEQMRPDILCCQEVEDEEEAMKGMAAMGYAVGSVCGVHSCVRKP